MDYGPFAGVAATSLSDPYVLVGVVVLLFVVYCVYAKKWGAFFVIAGIFLALWPVLQFKRIGILFGERFLYVPLLFVAVLASLVLRHKHDRVLRVIVGLLVVYTAAFGWRTHAMAKHWQNDLSFWQETRRQAPRSMLANYNLAMAYKRADRFEDALKSFEATIALDPDQALAWGEYGALLFELQHYENALAAIERMLVIQPQSARFHDLKGLICIQLNQYECAFKSMRQAVTLDDKNQGYRFNLILAYYIAKDYDEAVRHFDELAPKELPDDRWRQLASMVLRDATK